MRLNPSPQDNLGANGLYRGTIERIFCHGLGGRPTILKELTSFREKRISVGGFLLEFSFRLRSALTFSDIVRLPDRVSEGIEESKDEKRDDNSSRIVLDRSKASRSKEQCKRSK